MIVSLVVTLVLVGVALWLISVIPMDPAILQIVRALVIIVAVLYVLRVLFPGALAGIG